MSTDATSPAADDAQGPTEIEIPGVFKGKLSRPPTKFVIMCVLALGAVLGGAWLLGTEGRDRFPLDPMAVYAIQAAAGLLLVVSYFSDYRPRIISRRREEQLREWGLRGRPAKPGYFRLGPYEDNENDRRDYDRPDNVHHDVLEWLKQTAHPLVYLTGQSGCGKSSLLNAYVLPELRERNGVEAIRVRSFADTLGELRQQLIALSDRLELYKSTPDWMRTDPLRAVLEKLVTRWKSAGDPSLDKEVVSFRLLIVVDQFEELIIVNQLRESDDSTMPVPAEETTRLCERVAAVRNLLYTLNAQPIAGVRILLAFRSDYRTMLPELDLPSIYKADIHREVGPFTRAQAKAILEHEHCGFVAREKRLTSVLSEASIVDGHRGLIRPIVINMLGRVLEIHADKDLPAHKEGRLLSQEVRQAVEEEDIREHATRILDHMLSHADTKLPRRVGDLANETGLDPHTIEGTLFRLADTHTQKGLGLVRRITDAECATDRVWEVSHDFIARLLGPIIRTPNVSRWHRARPLFSPAMLIVWLLLCVGLLDQYLRTPVRIRSQLAEMAITLDTLDGEGVRATTNHFGFREKTMDRAGPLLNAYGAVGRIELGPCDSLTSIEGLKGLESLVTLYLTGLSPVSLQGLADLPRSLRSLEWHGIDRVPICGDVAVTARRDPVPRTDLVARRASRFGRYPRRRQSGARHPASRQYGEFRRPSPPGPRELDLGHHSFRANGCGRQRGEWCSSWSLSMEA